MLVVLSPIFVADTRVTTSDNERQLVVQRVTTNDND